jgi:hypothetical protein
LELILRLAAALWQRESIALALIGRQVQKPRIATVNVNGVNSCRLVLLRGRGPTIPACGS